MLLYELLRHQWMLGALGGGLVILLTIVVSYLAMWRPRPAPDSELAEGRAPEGKGTPTRSVILALPVVLVLTYIGIVAFMFFYFGARIISPPNW